jgi:hypothetical protein
MPRGTSRASIDSFGTARFFHFSDLLATLLRRATWYPVVGGACLHSTGDILLGLMESHVVLEATLIVLLVLLKG